ncbi:hypothetical protein [Arthrobacter sp. Soil764]|uniref:hypothetical protein n=1 Tax=Arthrobacter sp. Soil764 TaxID=1736403 RepID=UPI0006FC2142|nr:hypothetical protein [Arthrobacter sp. Soil764]KRE83384.1 hypothetical protein ASG86_09230 [Arthrobacter sp. Soil764]
MMELAGVLAAAVLLVTLVTLEVRRLGPDTGPNTGKTTGPAVQNRARNTRIVVGVMWAAFLLLLLPRVLGLLT